MLLKPIWYVWLYISTYVSIYIVIYMCICVCVCVDYLNGGIYILLLFLVWENTFALGCY